MNSPGKRLDALEKSEGIDGKRKCACENKTTVHYEGEPEPEHECPVCGGEKLLIRVVYTDSQNLKD